MTPIEWLRVVVCKVGVLLARLATFREVVVIIYRHERATPATARVSIRWAGAENLRDALEMDSPARLEEFRAFLAQGDRGYYAYQDGSMIHRAWVQFGPRRIKTWRSYGSLDLRSGEAYIHYCETAPRARGRGVYPTVLAFIASELRQDGMHSIFITTTEDNLPSRHGIERAGFAESARIRIRIRFGIERTRRESGCREVPA